MTFQPIKRNRLLRGVEHLTIGHLITRIFSCGLAILLLFALTNGSAISHAEPAPPREYQLKTAFIYSIIKFIEWPNNSVAGAAPPLNLVILGQDPFGEDLETIKGKSAKGRPIVIRHCRRVEEVKDCDVLFICASERGRLTHILKHLQNSPVLTVADQDGFCEAGGMINLVTVKNRINFEINMAAAQRAQLRISSQLLKLARIVSGS